MTQTEMFPKTTLELLEELAALHRDEYERAITALHNLDDDEKIARRYEKAEEKVARSRDLVRALDVAIDRERLRLTGSGRSIAQEVADVVNSGAMDTEGLTVTASVGVAAGAHAPLPADACPDCGGVGSIRDKTGGGHHRCKTCQGTGRTDAVVVAVYPSGDPVATEVGAFTRYAELIADWLTAGGFGDLSDWQVVAERELTEPPEYGVRDSATVIDAKDYGARLLVVAAEQGSVTGDQVPAAKKPMSHGRRTRSAG